MKFRAVFVATMAVAGMALASAHAPAHAQGPDDFYRLGPDSLPQEGVPKGKIHGPHVLPSEAYPGTQHTYWVYVPAQYDRSGGAEEEASLMVFQDGHAFLHPEGQIRAPNVLDNLIHRRELPVMLAVFINPGRTPEQPEPDASEWGDRTTNRATEYNELDDRYARVVCDELLPALEAEYRIANDPNRRGIGGASSGAIAAFTVAWQRPDEFRKVLSLIGSFTNIRGGDAYPDIIRQSDPKPLRIYLQDGRNDNRGQRRGAYDPRWDWFLQNTRMVEALEEKGYDLNYTFGIGRHSSAHGGAILPDMLRWLWRDHGCSADPEDEVERSYHLPHME
ncbi:Carbohydrate acetyl esterase/feruloyl esterase precursor [Pseudobythopirellula maris]|uniref:Carbohydrate acetyl esterase/feruloyl esterase n=1 Tax=Pseudobythopirellula maris TaxID=2527991 RepID=A0A5C5ZKJ5_9BACT|nr:alpha/beta hydrolase-fold protein [Pseudobythopirellula maris]TWT87686.1 Carbohydrate acetyl esterase/feruloyl esterase precursor [Pseudobythopirellula maris]